MTRLPTVAEMWEDFSREPRDGRARSLFYAGVTYGLAAVIAELNDDDTTPEQLADYTEALERELRRWLNSHPDAARH